MLVGGNKRLRMALGVLETANFLFVRALLKKPSAAKTLPGRFFRDYMSVVGTGRWQSRSPFEVFPTQSPIRVTIEHIAGEGIYTAIDELAMLAYITVATDPAKIFEIGTFRGRTALNFALNSAPECQVYTLDLPLWETDVQGAYNSSDVKIVGASFPGSDYAGKSEAAKIVQLYGNSLRFDFSPYVGQMDLVFVDGAHHYEAAKSDTANALRMIRPGGVVIWHDFANYGDYNDVTRAVLEAVPPAEVVQLENTQLCCWRAPA